MEWRGAACKPLSNCIHVSLCCCREQSSLFYPSFSHLAACPWCFCLLLKNTLTLFWISVQFSSSYTELQFLQLTSLVLYLSSITIYNLTTGKSIVSSSKAGKRQSGMLNSFLSGQSIFKLQEGKRKGCRYASNKVLVVSEVDIEGATTTIFVTFRHKQSNNHAHFV